MKTIQWFLLLTRCHFQPLMTFGHSWLEMALRERQKPFHFLHTSDVKQILIRSLFSIRTFSTVASLFIVSLAMNLKLYFNFNLLEEAFPWCVDHGHQRTNDPSSSIYINKTKSPKSGCTNITRQRPHRSQRKWYH